MSQTAEYTEDRGECIERVVEIYESGEAVRDHDLKPGKNPNMKIQQPGTQKLSETPDIIKAEKGSLQMEDIKENQIHTGEDKKGSRCYRVIIVCLLLLCVLMPIAIAVLSTKLTTLTTENNQLQASYNNQTIKQDQLQASYNNLTTEKKQLQTSYNNLTVEKNQLQASNSNLTVEKNQLEASNNNLTIEKNQLQASNNNLTIEKNQLQASNNNLTIEKNQLQASNNNLTIEKNQLQASNNNLTIEKNQLQASTSNLTVEKNQLQASNNNLAVEKNQLQASNNNLTIEKNQLQASNNNLTIEKNQLQASNNNLTIEKNQLQASNNNLTIEKNQLQASNSNLTVEKNQLQNENDRLQNKLLVIDSFTRLGWTYFSSSLYLISNIAMNWTGSRQDCLNRNADLVIINNTEEQNFINNLLGRNRFGWIGLTDLETDRVWKWVDSTSLTTDYWSPGEPNNLNSEKCTQIYQPNSLQSWVNQRCDLLALVICEKKP